MSAPVGLSFYCETLLIGIFQYTSIVTGAKEDRWYFLALLAFHYLKSKYSMEGSDATVDLASYH